MGMSDNWIMVEEFALERRRYDSDRRFAKGTRNRISKDGFLANTPGLSG
jgi:hypothetical protein